MQARGFFIFLAGVTDQTILARMPPVKAIFPLVVIGIKQAAP
jgi:hypothetical protein